MNSEESGPFFYCVSYFMWSFPVVLSLSDLIVVLLSISACCFWTWVNRLVGQEWIVIHVLVCPAWITTNFEILHFFVEECAVDVNYAKPGGATATFLAAQEGSMESLLFLISQRGEFTMLNVLQKRRSLNILKYL